MHGRKAGVDQAPSIQFTKKPKDPASTVHVFDVVLLDRRSNLADVRHTAAQCVDVSHLEVELRLFGSCQDVEHGVGASAHSDIKSHRVLECTTTSNVAGQNAVIVFLVVPLGNINNGATSPQEELFTVAVCCQHGAVTGQRQAQGFGQAIHGVRSEHAGA